MEVIWNFLRRFSQSSFWVGFAVGTLFWWMLGRLVPLLRQAWANLGAQFRSVREGLKTEAEVRYLNERMHQTQRMHLAAALFSLDEILIPPRLLAPPAIVEPDDEMIPTDIVKLTLPYMPDWPHLNSHYRAPRLTLSEALRGGADLALIGRPGSGKTVALADLTIQIARGNPAVGSLANLLPILIHVADLAIDEFDRNEVLAPIIRILQAQVSGRTASRIPRLVENAFESRRVLLMVDGLDELAPEGVDAACDFLATLTHRFQGIRFLVAGSPDYYGEITAFGAVPVVLAAWDQQERVDFMRRWGELWTRHINPDPWSTNGTEAQAAGTGDFEQTILNSWLGSDYTSLNPLEMTLKAWAAYAGDALGAKNADAIDAYIRRMATGIPNAAVALEKIASQMILEMAPHAPADQVRRWARLQPDLPGGGDDDIAEEDLDEAVITLLTESEIGTASAVSRFTLGKILETELLVSSHLDTVRFQHPILMGYFAGRGLAVSGAYRTAINQPEWSGKSLAMHYLAAHSDISEVTNRLVENDGPLHHRLFSTAEWLRDAPKENIRWRLNLMRILVTTTQTEHLPRGIRARAFAALVGSGDLGVISLCRKLVSSTDPFVRQLAALGLGYFNDVKSIGSLEGMLQDAEPGVQRAACLALASMGTQQAIEIVATALLQGSEDLQRSAAEALANSPGQGHALLKEASTLEDLLVRRAAVFGLARIGEEWSEQALIDMQTRDGQWVVRNAADQVIQERKLGSPFTPKKLPPAHLSPWLIQYAGQFGEGISKGEPAEKMLLRALQQGDEEHKLAALEYYRLKGDKRIFPTIYQLYFRERGDLQETALNALWHLSATGLEMPPPEKYGFHAEPAGQN